MDTIIYEKHDHVAHITLNLPDSLNAINRAMAREMGQVWADFNGDPELYVAILSARGRSFCAGANVKEIDRNQWKFRDSLLLGDDSVLPDQHQVYKPIIAALHGHVYGAGLVLALQCDIRIAADNAKLGLPEGKVNVPFMYAPFVFEHIPRALACEMIMTGKPLDLQKALDLCLVNRVVPQDELLDTADEIAAQVCQMGPLANRAAKELYIRGRSLGRAQSHGPGRGGHHAGVEQRGLPGGQAGLFRKKNA